MATYKPLTRSLLYHLAAIIMTFLIAATCLSNHVYADDVNAVTPQLEWSKTYEPYMGYAITQTADGGYLIAGQKAVWQSFEPHNPADWANYTAQLVKIDQYGNTEWTQTYQNLGSYIHSIIQNNDTSYTFLSGGKLVKTDTQGNIKYTKSVNAGGKLIPTSDKGYLAIATTMLPDSPQQYGVVTKLDTNGNTIYTKTFQQAKRIGIYAAIEDNDKNYLIAGNIDSNGWLAKLDSTTGDIIWNQTYNRYNDYGNSISNIVPAVDDGYLLSGQGDKYFLIKTTPDGVMQWNRILDEEYEYSLATTQIMGITQTIDKQGYLAVGYMINNSAWIITLDAKGNTIWQTTYASDTPNVESDNAATAAITTTDNGYVVTGQLGSKIWAAKFTTQPKPNYALVLITIIIVTTATVIASIILANRKNKQKNKHPSTH